MPNPLCTKALCLTEILEDGNVPPSFAIKFFHLEIFAEGTYGCGHMPIFTFKQISKSFRARYVPNSHMTNFAFFPLPESIHPTLYPPSNTLKLTF